MLPCQLGERGYTRQREPCLLCLCCNSVEMCWRGSSAGYSSLWVHWGRKPSLVIIGGSQLIASDVCGRLCVWDMHLRREHVTLELRDVVREPYFHIQKQQNLALVLSSHGRLRETVTHQAVKVSVPSEVPLYLP